MTIPKAYAHIPVSQDRSLFEKDPDYYYVTHGPLDGWVANITHPAVHTFDTAPFETHVVLEPDLESFRAKHPGALEEDGE